MRIYKFNSDVSIVNLGDLHRGNENFSKKKFYKTLKFIEENENVYWLSTGDMLETAIKSSKSSCYESRPPQEELETLSKELESISGKCLGFVSSNHQKRIMKEVGIDLDKVLAMNAGIPYLGKTAVIKVICGAAAYFIFMHHGVGGGTDGNKVNRSMVLSKNVLCCDVYMTGHTHTFNHIRDIHTFVDRKRNKMTDIKTHHVCTGHYIEYEGSYADELGLKKKPIGSSVITLSHNNVGKESHKKVMVDFV